MGLDDDLARGGRYAMWSSRAKWYSVAKVVPRRNAACDVK